MRSWTWARRGASDGLEADNPGRIYAGDCERDSIRQRQTNGEWRTIAHDPRILWPDTMSVTTDGYLYFTSNQLQRQAQFHEGADRRMKPYSLLRMKIDAGLCCSSRTVRGCRVRFEAFIRLSTDADREVGRSPYLRAPQRESRKSL